MTDRCHDCGAAPGALAERLAEDRRRQAAEPMRICTVCTGDGWVWEITGLRSTQVPCEVCAGRGELPALMERRPAPEEAPDGP